MREVKFFARRARAAGQKYVAAVDRSVPTMPAQTSLELLQEIPMGLGGLYHR